MDDHSDDSIIEVTPGKKICSLFQLKSKFPKVLPKKIDCNQLGSSCLLDRLAEEFGKHITQKDSDIKEFAHSYVAPPTCVINEKNRINIGGDITNPIQTTYSKNSHKMYVFYLIEEVLKFTSNHFPKNSHVQLVGVVKSNTHNSNSYLFSSIEQTLSKNYTVKLDIRELKQTPSINEKMVLFGLLTFQRDVPIIVAKFFRELTVEYSSYVDLMLLLRATAPLENFDMVSASGIDDSQSDEEDFLENVKQNDLEVKKDFSDELCV